jgi:hypothetical protein
MSRGVCYACGVTREGVRYHGDPCNYCEREGYQNIGGGDNA